MVMGKAHEDDEKNLSSWSCFLKPPLFLFILTLIPSTVFLYLRSSRSSISSLFITITILFISSTVMLLKILKNKTRVCSGKSPVQEEGETRPELLSDAETRRSAATVACEAFELDWMSSNHMGCGVSSCFDDDDDDEDSLIEITLIDDDNLSGSYERNLQRLRSEEDEIDDVRFEEENLIEIDISIGSIKRSTVEI